jgi:hypothetical protein
LDGSWVIGLEELSQKLWACADGQAVVDVMCASGPVVGMDHVDVAFVRSSALVSVQARWPLDADFHARYRSTPLSEHLPTTEAARTASAVFVEDLARYQEGHPALVADVEAAGFCSAAVLPLRDYQGTVLGVVGFVSSSPVKFDPARRAAMVLASELLAAALRRTDLAARSVATSALAGRLAAALSTAEVVTVARDHGPEALGAVLVSCRLLNATRDGLVAPVQAALPEPLRRRYEVVRLDEGVPLSDCVVNDRTIWLSGVDEVSERYPAIVSDVKAAGFESLAAIPLRGSEGTVMGALAIAWPKAIRVDPFFESTVQTVAEFVAQAVERAGHYDLEHTLVLDVQRRLLGHIPAVDGLDIAARYLPADRTAGVGGDWYDALSRHGTTSVVIGDVTGHGIGAATEMAQVRTVITGLLRADEPLETLIDRAEQMLDGPNRPIATLAVAQISPDRRELRYANAGHPWMLLRRADASVEVLDRSQRAMFGTHGPSRRPATLAIGPGDTLVLYTDGLVERRDESIDDGIDRLATALTRAQPSDPSAAIADALVEACATGSGRHDDDVAVVVLRIVE